MNEIQQRLKQNTLNTVSLFSGAGGLDIGAIMSGANIIWANDKMREACDSYTKNIGPHIHKGNIDDLKPELANLRGNVRLIIGGPPCQGFSVAGKMDAED